MNSSGLPPRSRSHLGSLLPHLLNNGSAIQDRQVEVEEDRAERVLRRDVEGDLPVVGGEHVETFQGKKLRDHHAVVGIVVGDKDRGVTGRAPHGRGRLRSPALRSPYVQICIVLGNLSHCDEMPFNLLWPIIE